MTTPHAEGGTCTACACSGSAPEDKCFLDAQHAHRGDSRCGGERHTTRCRGAEPLRGARCVTDIRYILEFRAAPCTRGPMQGPPCRAARERGARCVTDIWYFEIPGGHTRGPRGPQAAREQGARCVTDVRYFEIPGGPTRGPQGPQDRQRDRNIQDFRSDLKLSWPPPIRATWVGASGPEIWLPGRISAKAFPERIRPKSGPGKLLRIRPDMVDYSGRMCMTL